MKTRSKSNFTGVFTLKTQDEANDLAKAVTTLVERGVNIFAEVEQGTTGEIEATLRAVVRLSHSFEDLTLDEAETQQCRRVIAGLTDAEASIRRMFQPARRPAPESALSLAIGPTGQAKERRDRELVGHMQVFLASLAELCDMMEENQNKRGLLIIKQAVLHLQSLRDPRFNDFESKMRQFESTADMLGKYLTNRENVADADSSLKTRLAALQEKTARVAREVATASRRRNNTPANAQAEDEEKAAIVEMVSCLKEAGDIFSEKEGQVKTVFDFSYEIVEDALNTLAQAVQNNSRADATTQARVIVDALKQQQEANPEQAIALRAATVQLVSATKEALDSPSQAHAQELDKVVQSVKQQFVALAAPTKVRTSNSGLKMELLQASANLSNCLADLASPRFPSPRVPRSPRVDASPRAPIPNTP